MGADFDRHGNMIAGTNWGERAMLHQVQGAYYVKGFAKHGELQNPHAYGYFEHVPYTGFKGGHVTCGGVVYQGGSFPEPMWNQYIAANVLSNAIYWHKIERQGSSFVNSFGGELVTTDDHSFRPVDCTVGPDGSLFIADWYDKRTNHVDPKDDWDRSNGRIYKLVADGTKAVSGVNLARLSSDELVGLLTSRNEWYSREARLILAERRDPSILARLSAGAKQSGDARLALESLWTLYQCGGLDDEWRSSYSGIRPRMCGPGSCDCSAMINTFHPPWLHASWRSPAKSRVPSCAANWLARPSDCPARKVYRSWRRFWPMTRTFPIRIFRFYCGGRSKTRRPRIASKC